MARWHTMLRLNAQNQGWTYERLADLARVLRIPGTRNFKDPKNPKDVTYHSGSGGHFNLDDFTDLLDAAEIPDPGAQEKSAREWQTQFADKVLVVNLDVRIPQEMLDAWMNPANSDPTTAIKFRNTWFRQRHDLKDQTNSGYDMALVHFGIDAGLPEQQIVNLIVHHRAQNGQKQKLDAGYFRRTIAKAMASREDTPSPATAQPQVPPVASPAAPAVDSATVVPDAPVAAVGAAPPFARVNGTPPPVDAPEPKSQLSPEDMDRQRKLLLCQEISLLLGIEVLQMVCIDGKDPSFHMHTADGVVEFASVDRLITYGLLMNAIAAKTRRIINDFKPKAWKAFRQKLLNACFIQESTEEEEFVGGARNDVLDYLTETDFITAIEGQRVQDQRKPMLLDGQIAVSSSDFAAYLEKTKGRKASAKGAASMLGVLGASKTRRLRSSRYASQTRWALPLAGFDPAEIKPGLNVADESHKGEREGIQ
jgi:hypothetical protein